MIKGIKIYHAEAISDSTNDNTDVEVLLNNGERYVATFFTLNNISSLLKKYKDSGECHNGLYFWASDLIIVEDISEDSIKKTIDDLLRTGEFYSALSRIK